MSFTALKICDPRAIAQESIAPYLGAATKLKASQYRLFLPPQAAEALISIRHKPCSGAAYKLS